MKKRKEHERAFSYENYLGQMLEQVEEEYLEAQQEERALQAKDVKDEGDLYFSRGMVLGYKEILEKFRANAEAYGIKLQDQEAIEQPSEPNLLAYQSYLSEVLKGLLSTYRELGYKEKNQNTDAQNETEKDLLSGQIMSYYCVLENFRADAEIFEIPLKEIGLAKIIPLF